MFPTDSNWSILIMKPMTTKFIFVHLGTSIPRYLEENLRRTIGLFPKNEIYLLTNNKKLLSSNIKNLHTWEYITSERHKYLLEKMRKRKDFREGFWRLSLERLFALTQFQLSTGYSKLLLVESDVMVFPNFPADRVNALPFLAWCPYNSKLDIASLLYSANYKAAEYLQDEIEKHLLNNFSHTDMSILNEIRNSSQGKVELFPIVKNKMSSTLNKKSNFDNLILKDISANFEMFNGIFDGAALGVWLTGKNLENTHGTLVLHDRWLVDSGDSYVDPSAVDYILTPRGEIYLIDMNTLIPVYNLHIHSKNSYLLSSSSQKVLEKLIKLSSSKFEIRKFLIKEFLLLILLNIKRGKIHEFLLTFPLIYSIRMRITRQLSK